MKLPVVGTSGRPATTSLASGSIDPSLDLEAEIGRLKRERNAVILAHYYQDSDIQDVADFIGDSLQLAQAAAKTNADVICFAGCDWKLIKDGLRKTGLLPQFEPGQPKFDPRRCRVAAEATPPGTIDAAQRGDRALKIWAASKSLPGTMGEKYFTEHRGIDIAGFELDHAIKYHPGFDAVIALMTDPVTNEPRGIPG